MATRNGTKIRQEITVERISDRQTFFSLEAEWEALLKASGQQHVYLSHRWITGWLRVFGKGTYLWILIVKDQGRWIGAVPLVQSIQNWRGLPVRILHFPISFASANLRSDFIFSERPEEAALSVIQYLEEKRAQWDRWELSGLPADSPAVPLLEHFLARSLFHRTPWQPQHDYYRLPISGSFEEYLYSKSDRFNKTLRNRENRLNKAGSVVHRTLKTPEEVMNGVEIIFELEARSSKATQTEIARLEGEIQDFYRYLAGAFGGYGDGQIDLLEINGVAVASLFSLRMGGRLFLLYTCYDPSMAAVSPGLLLFRRVFEKAWSEGIQEIDFNGFTPNVLIWTDQHRPFLKGNIYNRSLRSRLVRFWEWTASTPLRRALKRAAAVGAKSFI